MFAIDARNVVLRAHQRELVKSLARSGRYQNAGEVLGDGLRLLERNEEETRGRLDTVRRAADRGWADVAAGRFDDVSADDLDGAIARLGGRAARSRPTDCLVRSASPTRFRMTSSPYSPGPTPTSAKALARDTGA